MPEEEQFNIGDMIGAMVAMIMLALVTQIMPMPKGELTISGLQLS